MSMRVGSRIAAVVVLSCLPLWAAAATWHVRTDGHDTNCNGTADASSASAPNCARLTIASGVGLAQAGDTLTVHTGTYSADFSTVRAGTSGARITIQAAAGQTVTIGGVNLNHAYVTLQNFRATGLRAWTGLFAVNASNVEIKNNFVYSNSSADYTSGVAIALGASTANVVISGNTFDGMSTPGVVGPSMYIVINAKGTGHLIENNVIQNLVDVERVFEMNDLYSSTFRGNEVKSISYNGQNGAHVDIFQYWSAGPQNIIIENNYFHDLQSQIGDLVDSTTANNITFRNNVFANIYEGNSAAFCGSPSTRFTNNTFYRVGNGVHPILCNYAPGATSVDIRNNIFYDCGGSTSLGWYGGGTGTKNYNYVATGSNGAKTGFSETNGINGGAVAFVAAYTNCVTNTCDFHLQSNSVVIDRGVTIGTYSTDKDGNTRSGTWDMGAYEYGVAGVLTAPTNLRWAPR